MGQFAELLRVTNDDIWNSLVTNPFVAAMADGSLPPDNFRFYIEQNIQYLPHYARTLGLGAARATTEAELRRFTRSLNQIVNVEIDANRRLRDRIIELGATDHGGAEGMAPACQGYTSYLIATAATGSAIDIMAAMLPCAWSYHVIASQYPHPTAHPVYTEWITFFAGDEYAAYLHNLIDELDAVVGEVSDVDLARLRRHFRTGARFEHLFWHMGFTMERWPDQMAGT